MNLEQLSKLSLTILFTVAVCNAHAQISLLQKTVEQLRNYRNLSYKQMYKQKEVFSDTLVEHKQFTLLKVPSDKTIGYFIKHSYYYAVWTPRLLCYTAERGP